jgi:hypothetical protein
MLQWRWAAVQGPVTSYMYQCKSLRRRAVYANPEAEDERAQLD